MKPEVAKSLVDSEMNAVVKLKEKKIYPWNRNIKKLFTIYEKKLPGKLIFSNILILGKNMHFVIASK